MYTYEVHRVPAGERYRDEAPEWRYMIGEIISGIFCPFGECAGFASHEDAEEAAKERVALSTNEE